MYIIYIYICILYIHIYTRETLRQLTVAIIAIYNNNIYIYIYIYIYVCVYIYIFYIYIYNLWISVFFSVSQYIYLTINITYINVHKRPRDSVHYTLKLQPPRRHAGATCVPHCTHSARVFAHAVGFSLSPGGPYIIYTYIARRVFTVLAFHAHAIVYGQLC